MMKKDVRVGMEVVFGRDHGEQTEGIVVKRNPTRAKVQVSKSRGRSPAGSVWSVPYAMLRVPGEPVRVTFSPYDPVVNHLMLALNAVYTGLSPENLTMDGEASPSEVRSRRSNLDRQLRGIQAALGSQVTEDAAWDWNEKYERHQLAGL
jgi:hypothetical protein